MDLRERIKHILKMVGHAMSIPVIDRLDAIDRQMAENHSTLQRSAIHTIGIVHGIARRQHRSPNYIVVEADSQTVPEHALMAYLYSHLPSRKAVIVGTENCLRQALLDAGFSVCMVETLASACDTDVSLVQIGEDRFDQDTIPAAETFGCPVVVIGYRETINGLTDEMRERGYSWNILLYRMPESEETAFYANRRDGIERSCGSIFFFRDHAVFVQAQEWCAAVLPETYFKPGLRS